LLARAKQSPRRFPGKQASEDGEYGNSGARRLRAPEAHGPVG
jgi:hypothetical protein